MSGKGVTHVHGIQGTALSHPTMESGELMAVVYDKDDNQINATNIEAEAHSRKAKENLIQPSI